jgi:hypothetical protein
MARVAQKNMPMKQGKKEKHIFASKAMPSVVTRGGFGFDVRQYMKKLSEWKALFTPYYGSF